MAIRKREKDLLWVRPPPKSANERQSPLLTRFPLFPCLPCLLVSLLTYLPVPLFPCSPVSLFT